MHYVENMSKRMVLSAGVIMLVERGLTTHTVVVHLGIIYLLFIVSSFLGVTRGDIGACQP